LSIPEITAEERTSLKEELKGDAFCVGDLAKAKTHHEDFEAILRSDLSRL
jgi:hypothetical protein